MSDGAQVTFGSAIARPSNWYYINPSAVCAPADSFSVVENKMLS